MSRNAQGHSFDLEDVPERSGARGGGRTHNLRLRRPTLYPIELPAHGQDGDKLGSLCLRINEFV